MRSALTVSARTRGKGTIAAESCCWPECRLLNAAPGQAGSRDVTKGPVLLSLFIVAIGRAAQPVEADAARDKWQRVAEHIAAMGAREGSRVADVGAGRGYMAIRLAAGVGPSGTVYAVDIAADALKALRERACSQSETCKRGGDRRS